MGPNRYGSPLYENETTLNRQLNVLAEPYQ
jgi:hypothetical protein